MSRIKIVNFYDKIKNKDDGLRNYPNEDQLRVRLPARILCLGPSGSGKTNITMNILKLVGIFDQVVLCAKDLEEKLYVHLSETFQLIEKKLKKRMFLAIDNIQDLPDIDEFDPKMNHLLIIDDMICENKKLLAKVEEFWIRGRKKGITMMFLSQDYVSTPKLIRRNSNYIIIKKLNTLRDLKLILSDFQLGVSREQLLQLYNKAVSGDFTNFFMIDVNANEVKWRFRKNFAPFSEVSDSSED